MLYHIYVNYCTTIYIYIYFHTYLNILKLAGPEPRRELTLACTMLHTCSSLKQVCASICCRYSPCQ